MNGLVATQFTLRRLSRKCAYTLLFQSGVTKEQVATKGRWGQVNGDRLDQLLTQVRAGDESAYRQFLAKAADRLRADLRRQVPGDSEVEDIVQECLIAIHKKRHTLDPKRPVGPWLRAIAKYKLIDHWRKRSRSPISYFDADAPIAPPALEQGDVKRLLSQLPQPQAEAVRLVHLKGLSSAEASAQAGIGLSALKLRVHRGMKRLKAMVDEHQT